MPSTRSSSFSRRHVLTAGAAALAAPSLSWAQASYPTHPVTLTHGFGAGGNADVVARLIAQKLSEGKSAAELLAHSPLALFDELGLRAQLSASRGQGLIALNDAVLDAARQAQA